MQERVVRRTLAAGVEVDAPLASALAEYLELLFRWNRRINLTGLGDDERGVDRLVVEPLVAAKRTPAGTRLVVDVGSGGGSPAIPFKLAMPEIALWMVESRSRKAAFLREVVRHFDLKDVVVEPCRHEELVARAELHGVADMVTVRAVRMDRPALEGLQSLLKVGGKIFLFLGAKDEARAREAQRPVQSLRWRGTHPLVVSLQSRLVVLEKIDISRGRSVDDDRDIADATHARR